MSLIFRWSLLSGGCLDRLDSNHIQQPIVIAYKIPSRSHLHAESQVEPSRRLEVPHSWAVLVVFIAAQPHKRLQVLILAHLHARQVDAEENRTTHRAVRPEVGFALSANESFVEHHAFFLGQRHPVVSDQLEPGFLAKLLQPVGRLVFAQRAMIDVSHFSVIITSLQVKEACLFRFCLCWVKTGR